MKFNPRPGDKIICNNGEEFIRCTLEFLNENGLAKCWEGNEEWSIREVIPQNAENSADKEEEVKEDSLYTVDEVFDAIFETTKHLQIEIPWDYIDDVKEHLSRKNDPQYQEYLRLKAIYE